MGSKNISPGGGNNQFIFRRIIQRLLICSIFLIVLVVGSACSNGVDDEATAESMTQAAEERDAESTEVAENMAVTAQAIEDAMATIDATTKIAEEQANEQATADSEATRLAQEAANEQATADAQAAVAAEATVQAEATTMAEATAQAEAFATASFQATREAFEEGQLDRIDEAQEEPPSVTLEEGALVHDEDEDPESETTGVNLRDFVVQVLFTFDSGETGLENGDVALEFRVVDESATYLVINQDGGWQLINDTGGDQEVIQEGQADALLADWNELAVFTDGDTGFFSLNGHYIEELDLGDTAEKGDILLVTGFLDDSEVAEAELQYREFSVWSQDPIPPTPTPRPTVDPATFPPHTFPETPIKPFDRDDFVSFVGRLRDSLRSYHSEMGLMAQRGKPGDCGTFNGWISLWITQSPGYTNVPPSFFSLYREYRNMLRQVVTLSQEVRDVCGAGGGFVTDETIDAINEFLTWAYPRSEEMVSEASVLPAP